MKTALTFDEMPAELEPETMTIFCNKAIVTPPAVLGVCAWCDASKLLTIGLIRAGYQVSHGVCERCKSKVMEALK